MLKRISSILERFQSVSELAIQLYFILTIGTFFILAYVHLSFSGDITYPNY